MGKLLVVAEKPSVAREYVSYLGNFEKKDGYYENDKYIITWSYGHIISRYSLYEYDERLLNNKENREYILKNLPYFPKEHILKLNLTEENKKIIKEREKTFKELFKRYDIDYIVNACDAGREGEAIFGYIYDYFKCKFPVKRLWVNTTVKEDVLKAFNNLLDGNDNKIKNLKDSAYARAEADWEFGMNLSAIYSNVYNNFLTIGRVQTPVLNMIVQREKEIQNFVPEDYFTLTVLFKTDNNIEYKGKLITMDKIKTKTELDKILNAISQQKGIIEKVEVETKTQYAPLLFDLTDLQKEMDNKYKMSAKETLDIAQNLYQNVKAISYPRTDSQYITKTMVNDVYKLVDRVLKNDRYSKYAPLIEKQLINKRIINDSKVSDHYAILPILGKNIEGLSDKEYKVLDAVVLRLLVQFMKPYKYEQTTIITRVGKYEFKTTAIKVIEEGFKAIYKQNEEEIEKDNEDIEELKGTLNEGEGVFVLEKYPKQKRTQPPKRYRTKTLLEAMEYAGRNIDIDDENILYNLKQKGLGTPATRAYIISELEDAKRGYIAKKGNYYYPTEKGIKLIEKINIEEIKSPQITGEWEYKLKCIEKGELTKEEFKKQIQDYIRQLVDKVKILSNNDINFNYSILKEVKCPKCNSDILITNKSYICSNYKNQTCNFVLSKVVLEKEIDQKQIIKLINEGETDIIKGFKKNEYKFNGKLVLDENKNIKFELINEDKINKNTLICPICGKEMKEYEWGYGCLGYKEGCSFSVSKTICGKRITKKQITDLIKYGETDVIQGFKSKTGKTFNARLKIENGNIVFIF